jgi:hypothetical protein
VIIDLRKPYQWDEINDAVKSSLKFEGTTKVFQSVSQAIFEIAMSVQNLYSHKKQFYYSLGMGTHADEGILYLARHGTKGIEFPADEPPLLEDKKTLFWLCDVDDAITGQLYFEPGSSSLDNKVFRIWISHRRHFTQPPAKSIGDNDIFIYSAEGGTVVAHFGKRAQGLQMILAPTLNWEHVPKFTGFPLRTEQQSWVENLESSKVAGAETLFPTPIKRIHDRALLVWRDFEAGALRDLLIKNHQLNPAHVECVSLHRWNEAKLIPQFEKRNWANEVFRGLLIFSTALANDNQITKKIESSVAELRKISVF